MSSGTIKTDTTPLFGPHSGTVSPKQDKSVRRKKEEVKTLAESLDDVLPQPGQSPTRPVNGADTTDTVSEYQFTPKLQAANGADGVDEMEWTPTAPASLPRSLKDSPSPGDRAFGQAPTHEDGRPFYYKAPPAPINPAHKLRNPPRQPALWNSAEKENDPSSFRGRGTQQRATQDGVSAGRPGVEFTKQNFFAPRTESAEDESLANMLGKTFSLDDERPAKKGWFW